MKLRGFGLVFSLAFALAPLGCGSGNGTGGTGGAQGTGGARSGGSSGSSGGATGSGGASETGGTTGSGGATSTGGATGTGGANATGGASATGGSAAGGSAGDGNGMGGRQGNGGRGGRNGMGGATATGGAAGGGVVGTGGAGGAAMANAMTNFFVSSDTSTTADLGGLPGADMRCQRLATAVGLGAKTWHAYLSAANPPTNARDRIGAGPYYNSQGAMVAADKDALHARTGDPALFITERGGRINGQWIGSPTPNQHDILTGTQRDGTIAAGLTCGDWTSTTGSSEVGHADGLGPNQGTTGSLSFWNAAHTGMCGNTAPGGGAGRIYCFVAP